MKLNDLRIVSLRTLAMLALAVSLMFIAASSAVAQDPEGSSEIQVGDDGLTTLTVQGVAARGAIYDGTVVSFTVSATKPSVLEAASVGNLAVTRIANIVEENCTSEAPENEDPENPTCVSAEGLQTIGIQISEDYEGWGRDRVSVGYRYTNSLRIAIQGTGFAGSLVDLVVQAGGDDLSLNSLRFTSTEQAELQRAILLHAIDDARRTARSVATHLGYEIVRIVRVDPVSRFSARTTTAEEEDAMSFPQSGGGPDAVEPTPVFAGSVTVTSRVEMVFELRPLVETEVEEVGSDES